MDNERKLFTKDTPSAPIQNVVYYAAHHGTIDYVCGHCGRTVSGFLVAQLYQPLTQWLLCPSCAQGSVLTKDAMHPPLLPATQVADLPPEVNQVYDEARKSFASQIYTGCEVLCRKILMNVAVHKGADEGKKFVDYIDYLKNEGHITASMKNMADIIRENGNKSVHEIEQPDKKRTKITLEFTDHVLCSIYTAESQIMKYQKDNTST